MLANLDWYLHEHLGHAPGEAPPLPYLTQTWRAVQGLSAGPPDRVGLVAVKTSAPSSSIEDYVKVIYSFTEWQDKPITSSQLAQRLGVANSSVSEMVRKLKDQGLVDHQPYSAITLTRDGVRLALSMVRRHRLIETYLVQELGYRWDEVHDEAELLEHAVSDTFIERMAAKLGNPVRDPHGDPDPGRRRLRPDARRPPDERTRRRPHRPDHPDQRREPRAAPLPCPPRKSTSTPRSRWLAASPSAGPWWCGSAPAAGPANIDLADEVTSALWVHSDSRPRRLQSSEAR